MIIPGLPTSMTTDEQSFIVTFGTGPGDIKAAYYAKEDNNVGSIYDVNYNEAGSSVGEIENLESGESFRVDAIVQFFN